MQLARNLRIVGIMRSEANGLQLDRECESMNGTRIEAHVGRLKDVKPGVEIFDSVDVLLLDVNAKDAGELATLEKIINTHFPGVPVVGTSSDATIQDVRQLMRLGVVDFVPQPITKDDLLAAISLASAKRRAVMSTSAANGKVISFVKGGGGVGATTIAVQAGCLLAADFAQEDKAVCLFDLDLQSGTAALYLDLDNRVGANDLMEAGERLDESILEAVTITHPSGLKLVGAPREAVPLDGLTAEFVEMLVPLAATYNEVTLFDLPPVWTEGTYALLQKSDLILVVTQLSVAGVRQAKHQLDTIRLQGLLNAEVRVVMNRYEKGWGKSVHLSEAEKALGCKVDYCIPNDYRVVSDALNQGVAIGEIKMRSKIEKGIKAMIEDALDLIESNRSASAEIKVAG